MPEGFDTSEIVKKAVTPNGTSAPDAMGIVSVTVGAAPGDATFAMNVGTKCTVPSVVRRI